MKKEIGFAFYLLVGILATFGGWILTAEMLLRSYGFHSEFELFYEYTTTNLIILLCTFAASIASLILAGPYLIHDAIKNFKKEAEQ